MGQGAGWEVRGPYRRGAGAFICPDPMSAPWAQSLHCSLLLHRLQAVPGPGECPHHPVKPACLCLPSPRGFGASGNRNMGQASAPAWMQWLGRPVGSRRAPSLLSFLGHLPVVACVTPELLRALGRTHRPPHQWLDPSCNNPQEALTRASLGARAGAQQTLCS